MRVMTIPRSRKATVLMVKHRSANLTYHSTLTRFGQNPSMETMVNGIYHSRPEGAFMCLNILLLFL